MFTPKYSHYASPWRRSYTTRTLSSRPSQVSDSPSTRLAPSLSLSLPLHHPHALTRSILNAHLARVSLSADKLTIENKLSLDGLMYLLSSMARDLQDDFLNLFFPRLITAVDSLFASGGSQDADAIGHVYTNLFRICKFLVKPMTRNIEFVADTVEGLLFSHHAHIRKFSAEMLS